MSGFRKFSFFPFPVTQKKGSAVGVTLRFHPERQTNAFSSSGKIIDAQTVIKGSIKGDWSYLLFIKKRVTLGWNRYSKAVRL